MEKGKFGEPWRFVIEHDGDYGEIVCPETCDKDGNDPLEKESNIDRACACVNALDGMNPDKLKGLVEASRLFVVGFEQWVGTIEDGENSYQLSWIYDKKETVEAALAALEADS